MTSISAQNRISEYLQYEGPKDVGELAEKLGYPLAIVRCNVEALRSEGLIESDGKKLFSTGGS
jgi:predicted transcriptional regulator